MAQESILYTNVYTTLDNTIISEAMEVEVDQNPNLQQIATLAKGFSGIMLGAAMCMVTLRCAVPSADFEFNPSKYMRVGKQVELGCVAANRQLQGKFFIAGANFKGAVNDPANLTIQLLGPMVDWE